MQMAKEPTFADALAASLRANPPWRAAMLQALQSRTDAAAQAQAQVMQSLQARGGLSVDEVGHWLNSLMAQGRWGEAYACWAGTVVKRGVRVPKLFNGDFSAARSSAGFDWHLRDVRGVLVNVEQHATCLLYTALARNLTQLGKRVLLVNADLRVPSLHKAFGLRAEHGLSSLLAGACSFTEVVQSSGEELSLIHI